MTHPGSGNQAWQDYPNTSTPVTAAALESIESALDIVRPLGVVARFLRTAGVGTTSPPSGGGAVVEVPVARIPFSAKAGRLYRVTYAVVGSTTAAGEMATSLRYTTNGANPTSASTLLATNYDGFAVISQTHSWHHTMTYETGGTDHTCTLLLAFWRLNGTGTMSYQASATLPIFVLVEDFGVDPGITGTSL